LGVRATDLDAGVPCCTGTEPLDVQPAESVGPAQLTGGFGLGDAAAAGVAEATSTPTKERTENVTATSAKARVGTPT